MGTKGKAQPPKHTYKGFQRAEQLRDALEACVAGPEQFFFCQACADGEVLQSQEVDVRMVRVVALGWVLAFPFVLSMSLLFSLFKWCPSTTITTTTTTNTRQMQ